MIFFKIDEETARQYRMPNIVQKSVFISPYMYPINMYIRTFRLENSPLISFSKQWPLCTWHEHLCWVHL